MIPPEYIALATHVYQWMHTHPVRGIGIAVVLALGLGVGIGALKQCCGLSRKKKMHMMPPGHRCPTCGGRGL